MKADPKKTTYGFLKPMLLAGIVLIALFFALFTTNVFAADISVAAEFENRTYNVGDTISVDVYVVGVRAGTSYEGYVLVEFSGMSVTGVKGGTGFDIKPGYQPGVLTVNYKTNSAFNSAVSGSRARVCTVTGTIPNVADTVVKVKATATENGVSSTSAQLAYKVKRAALPKVRVTPTPSPTPSPGPSETPGPTNTPTPTPSPTPTPEYVPTPTATLVILEAPQDTPAPTETRAPYTETIAPTATSSAALSEKFTSAPEAPKEEQEESPVPVGSVIFWAVVALVLGIWIGISIGAAIWKKNSIFVTDQEKKIIGKK